ncbi:hypothetical protein GGI12_004070 [Dipsacomyces acuminosporus]|nr:hypothetical protein GGI12_004070 [Dipsacomyces acuminosporus]
MAMREDGRVMCRNGHEQAGIVEEASEGIVEGATRRYTKRIRRETKQQRARSQRLYGNNARFLILQSLQHILKQQVTILVRDYSAPEELAGVVRNLWLMYVSQFKDVHEQDATESAADDRTSALDGRSQPTASQSMTGAQGHSGLSTADSMFNQYSETLDIDDSLDSLLRGVEDDIAKDEEEMQQWEEENLVAVQREYKPPTEGGQAQQQQQQHQSESTEHAESSEANASGLKADAGQAQDRWHVRDQQIMSFARMEHLPALIYLGFAWLRRPVTHADIFRLIADERIPYVSAYQNLPDEFVSRMGKSVMSLFIVLYSPSIFRLRILTNAFQRFYSKQCSLAFPLPDIPALALSLIKRLGLDIRLYTMAMRALELANVDPNRVGPHGTVPERYVAASIVIVLKLHYGLDEIERKPSPQVSDLVADLPPLRQFLYRWRSDWERELTIGIFPYLTALGDKWEASFAEYCKRLMTRRSPPLKRSGYEDLAIKYKRLFESLVRTYQRDPEKAARLLPAEYVKAIQSQNQNAELAQAQPTIPLSTAQDAAQNVLTPPFGENYQNSRTTDPLVFLDTLFNTNSDAGNSITATTAITNNSTTIAATNDAVSTEALKRIEPINWPKEDGVESTERRLFTSIIEPLAGHPDIEVRSGELCTTIHDANTVDGSAGYMIPIYGIVLARCAMLIGCSPLSLNRYVSFVEFNLCANAAGYNRYSLFR